MTKIILRFLLVLIFCLVLPASAEIANKDQIINTEKEILRLARERHDLAGTVLDLRLQILEVEEGLATENRQEALAKLKTIRKEIKANKDSMQKISTAISVKVKALKELLPAKQDKKEMGGKTEVEKNDVGPESAPSTELP